MRGRRGLFAIASLVLLILVAGGVVFSEAKLPMTATLEGGEDSAAAAKGEPAAGGGEAAEHQVDGQQEAEGREAEPDSGQETNLRESERQSTSEPESAEQVATEPQKGYAEAVAPSRYAEAVAPSAAAQRYAEQIILEEQRAAERTAAEQAAADQAAAKQVVAEQAAEQQYAQQVAVEAATIERVAAEPAAAEQAAAEQDVVEQQTIQQPVRAAAPAGTGMGLTIPKIGLYAAPVTDSIAESVLANGAGKIPSTGFPWQPGANTYIAGHVYGYPGTGSWQLFAGLPSLVAGDQISLTDSSGATYEYRVTEILRVAPTEVWVTQPTGQNMVSLQTCVGPGWSERLVVRAVMV